jgi:hypothetical protein
MKMTPVNLFRLKYRNLPAKSTMYNPEQMQLMHVKLMRILNWF